MKNSLKIILILPLFCLVLFNSSQQSCAQSSSSSSLAGSINSSDSSVSTPSPEYSAASSDAITPPRPSFEPIEYLYFSNTNDFKFLIKDVSEPVKSIQVTITDSYGNETTLLNRETTPGNYIFYHNSEVPVYIPKEKLANGKEYTLKFEIETNTDGEDQLTIEELVRLARELLGRPVPSSSPPSSPSSSSSSSQYCTALSLDIFKCEDRHDPRPLPIPGTENEPVNIQDLIDILRTPPPGFERSESEDQESEVRHPPINLESPACFIIVGTMRASSAADAENLCVTGQEEQGTQSYSFEGSEFTWRRCSGTGVNEQVSPYDEDAHCFEDPDCVLQCPDHHLGQGGEHSPDYSCDDFEDPYFVSGGFAPRQILKADLYDPEDDIYIVAWMDEPGFSDTDSVVENMINKDAVTNKHQARFHSYLWSNGCNEHFNICFTTLDSFEIPDNSSPTRNIDFNEVACEFY
jgi:hypothetical protein